MTISSLLANIADSISSISISGVTVKDMDQVVANWQSTPNVLYPNPDGYMTGFGLDYKSFTRGASSQVDIKYTLNYRFLGTQVGNLGNMPVAYAAMISKVVLIINAMITTTAPYDGKVDLVLGSVTFGMREDPAGNQYHGADIALNITEMQNT